MAEFITALSGALPVIAQFLFNPFVGACLILLLVGHKTTTKVFTRDNAYKLRGHTLGDKRWQQFCFYGRATLGLHAVFVGILLGCIWAFVSAWKGQPFHGMGSRDTILYFAAAGGCAEVLRVAIGVLAKHKGIVIALPGDSDPPAALPEAPMLLDSVRPPANTRETDLSEIAAQDFQDDEEQIQSEPTKPSGTHRMTALRPPPQDVFQHKPEVSRKLRGGK